jgi:hypothetical protein
MMDEIFHFLGVELEILGRGLAAVNNCGDAAIGAEFFCASAAGQ